MMDKLEKLVVALTDLTVQVTAYLAKQNGLAPGQAISREAAEQPAATIKPTRTRKPKDETSAEPTAAAPQPTAAEMAKAEEESYAELTKWMMAFIAKDQPGHEERRTTCEKHVAETYKVASLRAVPHGPQRMQLIQWAKDAVVKKNAAASPAGAFGV